MNLRKINFGKVLKMTILTMVILFGLGSTVVTTVAADPPPPRTFDLNEAGMQSGGSTTVQVLANKIIKYLAGAISLFSIVGIMIGGVVLMTAYGDEEKVQKGKSIITYSIIGLVFTLLAYVIVVFVQQLIYNIETY